VFSLREECDIKPIDGKMLQMTLWESDQLIVPMRQGNSCRGKGLAGKPLGQENIFRTLRRFKDGNKTVLTTYTENWDGETFSAL